MPKADRIYRRTDEGVRAYENQSSGLPNHHRSILGLIESDTHSELIRTTLRRRYPEGKIFDWLDELQTLGFLESEPVTARHDLDFTGGFNISELRAMQKAA